MATWEDEDLRDFLLSIGAVVVVGIIALAAVVGIVGGLIYVIGR